MVYVTKEATARGYRTGDPDWSNLGQGQPETGPLPGAPPRVEAIAIDPADHYYAPVAGVRSCARPWPRSTTSSVPAGHAVAVHGRERGDLRRRPSGPDAGRGLARPGQPRPLPARLHGLRRAARHLPAGHADPDPPAPRAGLRLRRRRPAARGPRPRPLGAAVLEPLQPHGQAGLGRRARGLGRRRPRARLHAAHRRVLLPLRLEPRRGRARPDGERRPLRRGRGPRSGGDRRRPDQELALSRLAGHLDDRAARR